MSTLLNVAFSDETEDFIIGEFGNNPVSDSFPFSGTVTTSDPRWLVFYNNFPEFLRANLPTPTTD